MAAFSKLKISDYFFSFSRGESKNKIDDEIPKSKIDDEIPTDIQDGP